MMMDSKMLLTFRLVTVSNKLVTRRNHWNSNVFTLFCYLLLTFYSKTFKKYKFYKNIFIGIFGDVSNKIAETVGISTQIDVTNIRKS